MYFITTKRMLEVCFFQHTPTFIIEPEILITKRGRGFNPRPFALYSKWAGITSRPFCLQLEFLII